MLWVMKNAAMQLLSKVVYCRSRSSSCTIGLGGVGYFSTWHKLFTEGIWESSEFSSVRVSTVGRFLIGGACTPYCE